MYVDDSDQTIERHDNGLSRRNHLRRFINFGAITGSVVGIVNALILTVVAFWMSPGKQPSPAWILEDLHVVSVFLCVFVLTLFTFGTLIGAGVGLIAGHIRRP